MTLLADPADLGALGAPTDDELVVAVALTDVVKDFGHGRGTVRALDGVSLDVRPGEFVCLVGASGCGKSTLLNLVADLDRPSAGTVATSGRTSVMFQESALFPWLTVRRNVELALELDGVSRAARRTQAMELLRLVSLDGFADRRPHELSGGMRQRVALARSLARRCDVLLMDEPFGALDAMTRDLLHDELERIWLDRRCAVLFVTHNVREAVRLGDRVVVLTSRPGRIAEQFPVDLPRPRRLDDPAVAGLAGAITDALRAEVARIGRAAEAERAAS